MATRLIHRLNNRMRDLLFHHYSSKFELLSLAILLICFLSVFLPCSTGDAGRQRYFATCSGRPGHLVNLIPTPHSFPEQNINMGKKYSNLFHKQTNSTETLIATYGSKFRVGCRFLHWAIIESAKAAG